MKPEELNPKAREAFGKSLIDVGVGIYKGVMLLFTVAPMTFLLKDAFDGTQRQISWLEFSAFVTSPAYFIFLGLLLGAFFLGEYFRREGIRHIHEIENRS